MKEVCREVASEYQLEDKSDVGCEEEFAVCLVSKETIDIYVLAPMQFHCRSGDHKLDEIPYFFPSPLLGTKMPR